MEVCNLYINVLSNKLILILIYLHCLVHPCMFVHFRVKCSPSYCICQWLYAKMTTSRLNAIRTSNLYTNAPNVYQLSSELFASRVSNNRSVMCPARRSDFYQTLGESRPANISASFSYGKSSFRMSGEREFFWQIFKLLVAIWRFQNKICSMLQWNN